MPSTPLSLPRAMLRRLAESASQNPIEVILTIFCVVTLAYFQLLHAITTSNFFEVDSSVVASYPFFFGQSSGATFGAAVGGTASAANEEGTATTAEELGLTQRMYIRRAAAKGQQQWEPFTTLHTNGSLSESDAELLAGAASYLVQPIIVADSEQGGAPGSTRHLRDTALPHVARALQRKLSSSAVAPSQLDVASFYVHDAASDLTAYAFARVQKQGSSDAAAGAAATEVAMTRKQLLAAVEDESVLLAALAEGEKSMPSAKPVTTPDGASTQHEQPLRLLPILSARDEKLSPSERRRTSAAAEELRSVRWMAYAVRALIVRFWSLLRKADSADIFVMLSAYLLMHGTFINLFLSMRKFGSRFWLGASVLISSIFGFLCALTAASFLGVAVDPVCLSEALPFLVITVGFEKPFLLTRAIFTHPSIVPNSQPVSKSNSNVLLSALSDSQKPMPDASAAAGDAQVTPPTNALSREESFMRALTARLKTEPTLRWDAAQPMPAHDVVVEAVEQVGPSIVRDYAIEIAVMAVGATSGVSGLREFCQLAALILLFDCIFLFAFFVAILTIMVEVHRIKIMRGMKRPRPSTPPNVDSDEASAATADVPASPSSDSSSTREPSPDRRQAAPKSLWRRVVKLILGRVPFEKRSSKESANPVARLKLLLIAAFLTLHSFNFVSTLTTQSAFTRHHAVSSPSLYQSITDASPSLFAMASPDALALKPFLDQLAKANGANVDIVARVTEPVIYVLVDATSEASARTDMGSAALNASGANVSSSAASHLGASTSGRAGGSLAILDSFLTGWSIIVGDPVISKWMSLALAISIFLNAYLLKGIATGDAAVAEGNAAGAAAFAAARMIGAHLDREKASSNERSRPQRRWSDKQDASELNAYHKKIAAQSQERARSTLATRESAKPIALAVNGEQVDSATSTPQQRESKMFEQSGERRTYEECVEIYAGGAGVFSLSDEEVILLAQKGKIAGYALEKVLQDNERAVRVRRALVSRASSTGTLETSLLPHLHYDYSQIIGACCENVVGFMPLPVGIAGPLTIDGQAIPIPMATTEGTLVASTSRGCKALNAGGGVTTVLTQDAMTRGPALDFPTITAAARAKRWVDSKEGAAILKAAFDSTSRFARLSSLHSVMAGRTLYVRFATSTGDAMGMNMIGKGVEHALAIMQKSHFPEMVILSLSGNYCIDKKPAALNWIMGRGKSVVAEAVIPGDVVSSVLKCTVASLVNLNIKKNLVGSAMAGSVGGFNAHAANILTAMFLATGQDPAQNVESSQCMTLMEAINDGKDLLVTCSMPCIEVGTVGGGTALSPQRSMLALMGVAGAHPTTPGANAQRLARIICAAVMAAEISLLGALSAGHLIRAHMAHNRSAPPTPGAQTPRLQMPQPHFPGTMTPLVAPPVESRQASPRSLSITSISEAAKRDRRAASSG